jgi:hypothetical protein
VNLNITGDEWRTLVLLPALVSLIVNLLTPWFQRGFAKLVISFSRRKSRVGRSIALTAVKQLENEIHRLRSIHADPKIALKEHINDVENLTTSVWTLLLILFVSIFSGLLTTHLPILATVIRVSKSYGFDISLGLAGVCGGILMMAITYTFIVKRQLAKLLKNSEEVIRELQDKRDRLLVSLED